MSVWKTIILLDEWVTGVGVGETGVSDHTAIWKKVRYPSLCTSLCTYRRSPRSEGCSWYIHPRFCLTALGMKVRKRFRMRYSSFVTLLKVFLSCELKSWTEGLATMLVYFFSFSPATWRRHTMEIYWRWRPSAWSLGELWRFAQWTLWRRVMGPSLHKGDKPNT